MAFNALLFMQSWFYLDVLLEIVMNKNISAKVEQVP